MSIELQPGAVIREAELMSSLELGRTPIREALKRLEAEDLVISTPHRGMHVAGIAITDLMQIFEVRLDLEALSARLAAQRIQPVELERMKALAREYQQQDQADLKGLFELDRRFHLLMAEAAHNRFLKREIGRYYDLSLRIWYMAFRFVRPSDVDVHAHISMLDCIEGGDIQGAEEGMRGHLRHFHTTIKEYL